MISSSPPLFTAQCEDAACDWKLGLRTDHADSAGARRVDLAAVRHPGGPGAADAAAATDRPRISRRLVAGTRCADRRVRRVLRRDEWPAQQAAGLGILDTRGARAGADRVGRLSLADPRRKH